MTTEAEMFVWNAPLFEEEMVAVARATVRLNPTRAYYFEMIDRLESTAKVMRDFLADNDAKRLKQEQLEREQHM